MLKFIAIILLLAVSLLVYIGFIVIAHFFFPELEKDGLNAVAHISTFSIMMAHLLVWGKAGK